MKKSFYEIEQEARRARSEEVARLLRLGASRIAASLSRLAAQPAKPLKDVRHA